MPRTRHEWRLLGLLTFSLAILPQHSSAYDALLRWTVPSETVAGYRVYTGPASRSYDSPVECWAFESSTYDGVVYHPLQGLAAGASYYVAVTAYNAGGESEYSNEKLIALAAPVPPVADAGPDQSAVVGQTVTLGAAAEPGVSYFWTQTAGAPAVLLDRTSSAARASATAAGSYEFTVTAYGADGVSASDSVVVSLSDLAPSATAAAPPSATRTGTATFTRTRTATRTSTPVFTATSTPTPTRAASTQTSVASGTRTATGTPVSTMTAVPSSTATRTPPAASTPTSGTRTATPTRTRTRTRTATPTRTRSWLPTQTATPSATPTPTAGGAVGRLSTAVDLEGAPAALAMPASGLVAAAAGDLDGDGAPELVVGSAADGLPGAVLDVYALLAGDRRARRAAVSCDDEAGFSTAEISLRDFDPSVAGDEVVVLQSGQSGHPWQPPRLRVFGGLGDGGLRELRLPPVTDVETR